VPSHLSSARRRRRSAEESLQREAWWEGRQKELELVKQAPVLADKVGMLDKGLYQSARRQGTDTCGDALLASSRRFRTASSHP
jgi:hypothetical protein